MIFNKSADKFITPSEPTKSEASLLDISDFYSVGSTPPSWNTERNIPFLVNPANIDWGVTAQYGSNQGHLTTHEHLQYGSSKRDRIKLPGMILDSQCGKGTVVKWLDEIEKLTRPGLNSFPPVLAFVWGGRVLQPIVLTNVQVRETAWLNGLVSRATVDLEFAFHKASTYRSSADKRRVESLTEREQSNIKTQVEAKAKEEAAKIKDPKLLGSAKPIAPVKVSPNGSVRQGGKVISVATKKQANNFVPQTLSQQFKVPSV